MFGIKRKPTPLETQVQVLGRKTYYEFRNILWGLQSGKISGAGWVGRMITLGRMLDELNAWSSAIVRAEQMAAAWTQVEIAYGKCDDGDFVNLQKKIEHGCHKCPCAACDGDTELATRRTWQQT